MLHEIFDTLLPAGCLICRKPAMPGLALCPGCYSELALNDSACTRCARPLTEYGLICGQCQQHPPHYDAACSPLHYRDHAWQLILDLKFREKLRNARLLAALFHARLPDQPAPQALIPVPLHPKRLRERGYNQSLQLARELRRLANIPVDHQAIQRCRHTVRQSDLQLKDRRGNVRNAFEIRLAPSAGHVAIVDDVMTSGHTVNEVARILKKSGVERVDVWAMARASKP